MSAPSILALTWGTSCKALTTASVSYTHLDVYKRPFQETPRLMGQYVDTEVKSAVGRADVVIKMQDAI